MHVSLFMFNASILNNVIVDNDFFSVRYRLVSIISSDKSYFLRYIPICCHKWFWPPIKLERKKNASHTVKYSWIWSVWPERNDVGRRYTQRQNTATQLSVKHRYHYSGFGNWFIWIFLKVVQIFLLQKRMRSHPCSRLLRQRYPSVVQKAISIIIIHTVFFFNIFYSRIVVNISIALSKNILRNYKILAKINKL